MSNSACDCCEKPPLNVVRIEYRSRSIAVQHCGIFNEEDGKYYFQRVKTYIDQWILPEAGTITITDLFLGYDMSDLENGSWNTCLYDTQYSVDVTSPPYDDGDTFNEQFLISTEYSNEVTPEYVMNVAEAAIAVQDFSNWTQIPAGSEKVYSEGFANIVETEVRIVYNPTAFGYLRVWLSRIESTYFEGGYIDPQTILFNEYISTDEPRFRLKDINDESNLIYSDDPNREVPIVFTTPVVQNKSSLILMSKFSLIYGYVPDDPDPFEKSEFPDEYYIFFPRPVPDCRSNGVPTISSQCPAF